MKRHPFRCHPLLTGALVLTSAALVLTPGISRSEKPREAKTGATKKSTFSLWSSAFKTGEHISPKYTADGPDISPPLEWKHPPKGTKAFALVCEDLDAPTGKWVHWVIYDIPPGTTKLESNTPKMSKVLGTAIQGRNDFRKIGYAGPAPPRGKPHRYVFRLYAIGKLTGLKPGATMKQLLEAVKGHVLGKAELMGTFQRR